MRVAAGIEARAIHALPAAVLIDTPPDTTKFPAASMATVENSWSLFVVELTR